MKLNNNIVCIVTGGISGLGLAAAKALLFRGCKVVLADFNEDKGAQVRQELMILYPNSVEFFLTDVTDEENVKKLIQYTLKKFGSIHVVLNSAGVATAGMVVTSKGVMSSEEMLTALKINVIGTLNVCKHAAAEMIKQDGMGEYKQRGLLINVSSLAGLEGQRGQTAYAASKGAVNAMTLPMARDLGKYGIRVVTIAPGIFDTPMSQMMHPKYKEFSRKAMALERFGNVSEFGECVIGICECSYLTGEIIRLDGGLRIPHL